MEMQQYDMKSEMNAIDQIWREIEEKKVNSYVVDARASVSNGLTIRWKKKRYRINLKKYLSVLRVLKGKIVAKSEKREFKIETYEDFIQVLKKSKNYDVKKLKDKTGIDEWILIRIKAGEYAVGTLDFMIDILNVMGYTLFLEFPEKSQPLIL